MSEFKLKFKIGEKETIVKIPKYLRMFVPAQMNRYIFNNNIIKSDICYTCGVNYTRLNESQKTWIENKVCSECDFKTPVLAFHITSILSFRTCQQSFWNSYVLGIKVPPSIWLVEGIVGHTFDKFLLDYFSREDNYERIKRFYPSKTKIQREILNLLRREYDNLIEITLKNENSNIPSQLLITQKEEMFEDLLNDYAYIFTKRLYNDIKFGGEFRELQAFKWREEKVLAYDKLHDVRALQIGRIDKLFQIKDKLFAIWDDKTKKRVRYWKNEFSDSSRQLGGYSHCLKQMYGVDVHVIGVINLLRYFYPTFVYVDEEGYLDVLDELCLFIREMKTPLKRPKGSGLCKEEYCGYFNRCWKGEVL